MTWGFEEIWLEAFKALPDVRPLAKLLRSDVQMPPRARMILAELLAPAEPPMSDWLLKCEPNLAAKKARRKIRIEKQYRMSRAVGLNSEGAAEQAGKPNNVDVRQVHRIVKAKAAERLDRRAARLLLIKMTGKVGGPIEGE